MVGVLRPNSCGTCVWKMREMQDGKQKLFCHRRPPQVVGVVLPVPQGISIKMLSVFPEVAEESWCAEHGVRASENTGLANGQHVRGVQNNQQGEVR